MAILVEDTFEKKSSLNKKFSFNFQNNLTFSFLNLLKMEGQLAPNPIPSSAPRGVFIICSPVLSRTWWALSKMAIRRSLFRFIFILLPTWGNMNTILVNWMFFITLWVFNFLPSTVKRVFISENLLTNYYV